jgi:hypothetical protein
MGLVEFDTFKTSDVQDFFTLIHEFPGRGRALEPRACRRRRRHCRGRRIGRCCWTST